MRHALARGLFVVLIAAAGCGGQGTVATTAPRDATPNYVPAALANARIPRAPSFAAPRAPGAALRASRNAQPQSATPTPTPPPFFNGQTALTNGVYYLSFSGGNYFGYYSYLSDPRYVYHFDAGYEYTFDADDGQSGIYFYDFTSQHFWYTTPALMPYLYDFSLDTYVYYYPSSEGHYTSNPRYFYNFRTGAIVTM